MGNKEQEEMRVINRVVDKKIDNLTIVRYKIILYKKFMPPDKPLYQ
jgi:hypothetical protein